MNDNSNMELFGKGVKHGLDHMKPLKKVKSPIWAGIIGFFFGPLGIGLYFGSLEDFFVCLLLLIILGFIIPGLGLVPGWLFSAGYGMYRAISSNSRV